MLPIKGSTPDLNVLYIGAYLLKLINGQEIKRIPVKQLFQISVNELSISTDHIILSLDWLYAISAIDYNNGEIYINEID